ncbi:DICT sensory domain-containing protein [Microcoleus sp. FACHB-672]|uniref:DICT sensory domain-containing protein n=1 Tax=Microcoleus sp. FACHB-672 TaxID=2692825 RepID=UPI001687568D|nr:DICT sensory domain-containing protein [Microcoleus sp. FACHB-672]MBD2039149.1 GAF domain-containing protein [Microcoleus sp. FACHB-672]
MSFSNSLLENLLQALPQLRSQIYFKSSLTALSHAMEDQVLAGSEQPLVIASFQRERFYRQEAHRYRRIAQKTDQVYVLAAPETDFTNASDVYETVAFNPTDRLSQEWHLIVIAPAYATCLICQERETPASSNLSTGQTGKLPDLAEMDQARRFEGIWTFDRQVTSTAAGLILSQILKYRPELADKIERARNFYNLAASSQIVGDPGFQNVDPGPFAQRLVTYLQAGQHKLLKTYGSIAAQERKERMVNSITAAIRQSLNPAEIFKVAVQELGQALNACRCLIYRCKATDANATILYEFLGTDIKPLAGQIWPIQSNPLFQEAVRHGERVYVENAKTDTRLAGTKMQALVRQWQIGSWLMVPVLHQSQLVGMVELHHCSSTPRLWEEEELALVDAIAAQVGVALIQAEAYANLEDLNQQLEALDRTRSNLIAITGHELRTPLSTIQVCLESMVSDPDMPIEVRQVMLSSAVADADRLRKLVQDFLTLSRLESGRVEWHPEPLPLQECVELALSSIRARRSEEAPIQITTQVPEDLPLVQADGEWLVEVLAKLLDNACKFNQSQGQVRIEAHSNGSQQVEVLVADTGRGIEPNRLDAIFDRFYQEEGALRRTAGGTGLGLAICRQIVTGWGGQIWAISPGKDQGSEFHFTIPIAQGGQETAPKPEPQPRGGRSRRSAGSGRRRTTLS